MLLEKDEKCLIDKFEKSSNLLREAFSCIDESEFDYKSLYYIEKILADIKHMLDSFGVKFEDVYNNTMLKENEYANDFDIFLSYMCNFSNKTDLGLLNEKLKNLSNRK